MSIGVRVLPFVLLGLVACSDSGFEFTDAAPLGSLAKLEEQLLAKGLIKDSQPVEFEKARAGLFASASFGSGKGTVFTFVDDKHRRDENFVEIYVDSAGAVVGVGARFRSDAREFEPGFFHVGRFIGRYWVAISHSVPEFKPAPKRGGIIGKERLATRFDDADVRGTWVKNVMDGSASDKILDELIVWKK